MEKIDISIIVPIYNVEKYLEKCLDSIYAIKNLKKEVILVNDSSPDNCYEIINSFAKKYSEETIVINKKNGGLSSARNSGLEIAQGRYVSFIDSDDYIDSKKFENIFIRSKNENLDIIIGRAKKTWEFKEEILEIPEEVIDSKVVSGNIYLKKSLKLKKHRVEVWDDFYRREFLKKNKLNFKEGIIHEDVLFTFKAFILAQKVKCYNIDFYNYRQREGSIMSTINNNSIISRLIIIEELLYFFENKKINNKLYNDYLINYLWIVFKSKNKIKNDICLNLLNKRKYSIKNYIKLLIIYFFKDINRRRAR